MIKKKYVKVYIEEAYCDKCGAPMEPTGGVLLTYPEQFGYVCSNKDCDFCQTFFAEERPGILKYEEI